MSGGVQGLPHGAQGAGGGVGWRVGSIGLSLLGLLAYIGRSSARLVCGLPVVFGDRPAFGYTLYLEWPCGILDFVSTR